MNYMQNRPSKTMEDTKPQNEFEVIIKNLTKTYLSKTMREPVTALQDISLNIVKDEFLCLIGPSGCGKSTLLKIVGGLIPFTSGELLYGSGTGDTKRPPEIGMVFQSPVLFPWKDVLHNVMLPAILRKSNLQEARDRAMGLLAMVGLSGFELRPHYELSGGMQQRVSICRALMCDAPMLLMDEPFGALDALTRDELAVELKRICQAQTKTVVFVTHSVPEAVFLGDRVAVMSARPGRIDRIIEIDTDHGSDLAVMATPAFQTSVAEIRQLIQKTA